MKSTRSAHTFIRTSRQLHVLTSIFDWFIRFSMSFVIGWSVSDNNGFTPDWMEKSREFVAQ